MIYEPREDSYLLKKFVEKYAKGRVLDIGTGTGIQAVTAAKKARNVLATDISPVAIDYCKKNIKNKKITFKKSDLFKHIRKKFDLIIFNPPYLPEDAEEPEESKLSTTGGRYGYELTERFISQAANYLQKDGKILLLFSSMTNKDKIDKVIENYGFEFKQLGKKKIDFEELYVYLVTRLTALKKLPIKNIKRLARGWRGVIYLGELRNKKVVIKVKRASSKAKDRIPNEAKWLRIMNKRGIGPKLLMATKDYVVMEYLSGEKIWEFMQHSTRAEIRRVIREVLRQCYIMDKMKVSKEEMHHPIKHIIMGDSVKLVDFERCHKIAKPKNVTQFCQFLTSGHFSYGLENKGMIISKKILVFAQKYKKNITDPNFQLILDEI